MNIQTEKLEIMKMLLETDNPGILDSVKKIFERELKVDFWESLPSSHKDDILSGIKEIENGEFIDYEDFINKYK